MLRGLGGGGPRSIHYRPSKAAAWLTAPAPAGRFRPPASPDLHPLKIGRMTLSPSLPEFLALAREATLAPVGREGLFDTDTAVTAYAKLARPPFRFLLESVVGGETWARWTFLGTEPRAAWKLTGRRVETWTPDGGGGDQRSEEH